MSPSKGMIKNRLRGLSKSFGTQIAPEKSEELKRTKTDIENNLSRVQKLIKNEEQSSKKEGKELVGLIEDFYNQYQSLYALYGRLSGEYVIASPRRVESVPSSVSSSSYTSSSESEYFSSEEVDGSVSPLQSNDFHSFNHHKKNLQLRRLLDLEFLLDETRGNLEEKIKRSRNESLSQSKELEAQLETEREKVSQCSVRIENLKENLAERTRVEKRMVKERERFLARIEDLELEVESRCSKQNDLEEQLRDARSEINRVTDEGRALQKRNRELERALMQREEEISEIDSLRVELHTLQDQKRYLELQNERRQEEYSENLTKMENLNATLETRVAEQEEIWSMKLKTYKQLTEKKMEELAEEFLQNMEDNILILHQRIHMAEQLNNENKENYEMTKKKCEQECKMAEEKVACYENELRMASQIQVNINELDINGLEMVAGKLEEQREQVSKMKGEVRFAKDWIRERNVEMKRLKEKVDYLTVLLGEKEEQELLLRERVWKLEVNVSKEGGEKLNLMKAVSQLERKVGKLENNLRDKEEELVWLGEKKREAIKQLCFLVEFHRNRWLYLKDLMLKRDRKVNNRK